MKRIIIVLIVLFVFCLVFVGVYVEICEVYNMVFELYEVILCVGYNFDMGVGLMFINVYNVGKWDEFKYSYNEIEGWYLFFKFIDKFIFQFGGLINDSSVGLGGVVYLDINYKFMDGFNLMFCYCYNYNNYDMLDYNGQMDKNDMYEFVNYWNFKVMDVFFYIFELYFFQWVNDYYSKNGKDYYWEIINKFSYKIDKNWLLYFELQWLDRWNDYNWEQYWICLGLWYLF